MVSHRQAAEINARGIGKDFGNFAALNDISMTIGRGEFLTLLGPSGSGKTTFLMVLAGFETPTRGDIYLDGQNVTRYPAEQRGFGMVFQGYALFPHMTVEQNIAFPLKVQKRTTAELRKRVGEMIEIVGLEGHGHKRPSALSGGQQQRVALARALVCEPSVLLLDEPFSALDKNLRGQMQSEVNHLHHETGTTFVFVTHDQSEALALSSRIAIFDHGQLQQVGTPKEVYEHPENRFVAEFLGDINIFPLCSVADGQAAAEGVFEKQPLKIQSANGAVTRTLAVRPEYMLLAQEKPAEGNAVQATVTNLTYLGAGVRIELQTPNGTPLTLSNVSAAEAAQAEAGSNVWVGWSPDNGIFL